MQYCTKAKTIINDVKTVKMKGSEYSDGIQNAMLYVLYGRLVYKQITILKMSMH